MTFDLGWPWKVKIEVTSPILVNNFEMKQEWSWLLNQYSTLCTGMYSSDLWPIIHVQIITNKYFNAGGNYAPSTDGLVIFDFFEIFTKFLHFGHNFLNKSRHVGPFPKERHIWMIYKDFYRSKCYLV